MIRRTAFVGGAGILALGVLTSFSPHVWERGWPRLDVGVAAFELWTVIPFALLAGLVSGRLLSRFGALLGVALAMAGTLLAQSVVDDDAQGALALAFMPIWVLIAVLILWGVDALVRAVVSRVQRERRSRLSP